MVPLCSSLLAVCHVKIPEDLLLQFIWQPHQSHRWLFPKLNAPSVGIASWTWTKLVWHYICDLGHPGVFSKPDDIILPVRRGLSLVLKAICGVIDRSEALLA